MVILGINVEVFFFMVLYGMIFFNLKFVEDDVVLNVVVVFFEVYLVRVGEGEDDYIVVVLDVSLCYYELCFGEYDKDV